LNLKGLNAVIVERKEPMQIGVTVEMVTEEI